MLLRIGFEQHKEDAMNEKIANFVKFYKGISTYGPARAQNEAYRDSYNISFDENDFATQVYVPVPIEDTLWDEVDELFLGKIITLCGPAGSGKSSVSLMVKRRLEANPRNFVIFVDMRLENSAKYYDDKANTINESAFRELILSRFRSVFHVDIKNKTGRSRWDELMYFILSPEEEYRTLHEAQIFNVFSADIVRISLLYKAQVPDLNIEFKDWFYENLNTKEISALQLSVFEKLDVSHYVSFARFKNTYDKFIIWLDNIDSFPNNQQLLISSFLQNLQRSILNSSNIVISVREENIYRIGAFNDYGNLPFPSRVTFEDAYENDDVEEYDALNIPVATRETLEAITRRKIDFGVKKYRDCVEKKERGESLGSSASGIVFSHDSRLTSEEAEVLIDFSARLSKSFDGEKVIYLSNNSIRDYLQIHAGFLQAVFGPGDNKCNGLSEAAIPDWKITTEFLSWLHRINAPFRLEPFNVFKEVGKFRTEDGDNEIGCFLPYLLLTTVWNECLRLKDNHSPGNNPHLADIINVVSKSFSFKRTDVLHAIFSLYVGNTGRNHFITFRDKKRLESPDELENLDTTVRITLRGKAIIGSVISSYGYLSNCIESSEVAKGKLTAESILVNKVKELSEVHLKSLEEIRTKFSENDVDWFNSYLAKYGLPLDPRFVRNSNVGFDVERSEHKRAFYLQTLYMSLSSYFYFRRKLVEKEKIDSFASQFSHCVKELRAGREPETFKLSEGKTDE